MPDIDRVSLFCVRYQDNKDIPLLVLANKQDLPSALGGPDVSQVNTLWHENLIEPKTRHWGWESVSFAS